MGLILRGYLKTYLRKPAIIGLKMLRNPTAGASIGEPRALAYTSRTAYISYAQVSEVRVKLGVTLGYARPPKVRDISSKYYPPPLGSGPYFLDASLRPRLVLG